MSIPEKQESNIVGQRRFAKDRTEALAGEEQDRYSKFSDEEEAHDTGTKLRRHLW